MIPESEYIRINNIPCVSRSLINQYHTKEEAARFFAFMSGQTAMAHEGDTFPYAWDYERWVQEGKKTRQHPLTWD